MASALHGSPPRLGPREWGSSCGTHDIANELGRGLDTLRREIERLRRGPEERL